VTLIAIVESHAWLPVHIEVALLSVSGGCIPRTVSMQSAASLLERRSPREVVGVISQPHGWPRTELVRRNAASNQRIKLHLLRCADV
jgi:hypothetical protein